MGSFLICLLMVGFASQIPDVGYWTGVIQGACLGMSGALVIVQNLSGE